MRIFPSLQRLIACLSRLPGIGRRSAERIALKLIVQRESLLPELIMALQEAQERLGLCSLCGGITPLTEDPCTVCTNAARDGSVLCVVEDPMDLLLIEAAGEFRGRYHVLMGKISPMQGEGLAHLRLQKLQERITTEGIREVILALNSDVESEATASFLCAQLAACQVRITRPARGLPVGSGIAYTDALTLTRAMQHRQPCADS
ncbi:MAG: recombination protein RecR [Lentisphaerae bacterium]|nr:recombination protein RecR [Lentisphaerota bacterium]